MLSSINGFSLSDLTHYGYQSEAQAPTTQTENPYTKENNEKTYNKTLNNIKERYASFNSEAETGYNAEPGLVGNIRDISKEDIIAIMMHIRDNNTLLEECCKNSAKSPFFDKFYLMKDPEQGWNLRLHNFNARGSGLGGDDSPHYHRWTLASKPIHGGYINIKYDELEITASTKQEHIYNKYKMGGTDVQQSGSNKREVACLGQKAMVPKEYTPYLKDSVNHFSIEQAHSVKTFSEHFGSTVTLAHTSSSKKAESFAFEKNELQDIPQVRYTSSEEFKIRLEREIAFLQVMQLKDDLLSYLHNKFDKNPKELTPAENIHRIDSSEPNYIETSLLSAIAIYCIQKENGIESCEFSEDTTRFIDAKLAFIKKEYLDKVIEFNQEDQWAKRFKIDFDLNTELALLQR